MRFRDRLQAGEVLAGEILDEWKELSPLVIALPRGGVPVAYPIARKLNAPLGLLFVRKLGAPQNSEYALGAIAEDGSVWVNPEALHLTKPTQAELNKATRLAIDEIHRQKEIYQSALCKHDLKSRTILLVDDGLATGSTMKVAIASLKAQGASRIAVAVPVASKGAYESIGNEVDLLYVAYEPEQFRAVGDFYQNFRTVSDQEIIELLKRHQETLSGQCAHRELQIGLKHVTLAGELNYPKKCKAWIVFAHGSGSVRNSPRNLQVSRALNEAGFGTLLFDLLTPTEAQNQRQVFDIELLACRLSQATDWLKARPESKALPIGYFGASTGAAAALRACAHFQPDIFAVVSRGGRPDLAQDDLNKVSAPVLLIVGSEDYPVIEHNAQAQKRLQRSKLEIIPGAGHLFEESGALARVSELARAWFSTRLKHSNR